MLQIYIRHSDYSKKYHEAAHPPGRSLELSKLVFKTAKSLSTLFRTSDHLLAVFMNCCEKN